jgi:hypothetical protein
VDLPQFRDDIFDNPSGDWVNNQIDERFTQRYLRDETLIYCETLMTVHNTVDIDAAAAMIMGPWDWWEHGRITDFKLNPDGSTDQTLAPVWWFITRVGLHIFPPAPLSDSPGQRMPLMLTGHFAGPSSMDVYRNETSDGLIVRGRFHGVEYTIPAVPDKIAEGLHLGAEAGDMPPPFPKGTGWVGLLHKLETHAVLGIQSGNEKTRPGSDDDSLPDTSDNVRRNIANQA